MARAFALIALVHPVLHRVSCGCETIPNAPKHYATHQNMILGSNGVDWVRSLQKISTWLRGTYFCINCTSSHCFAPSFIQLRNDPNAPKRYATHQNMSLGSNVVDWVCSLQKNPDVTSWHKLLHLLHQFTLFCIEFHGVTKWSQMHRNTTERTKTLV